MARIDSFRDLGCLVTGASSGIGREIALLLADEGARLVVTARRGDRLQELAAELRARGASGAFVVVADLADRGAADHVAQESERLLGAVDVLINNAGFSVPGPFVRSSLARTEAMLNVNVVAATALMRRLLPAMVKQGRGGVLNVASIAGFMVAPYQSGYAGTKAYLLNLSESVYQEIKGTGVVVTALCPGVTDTEFFEAAGYKNLGKFLDRRMPVTKVAGQGLRGFQRGKRVVIPGLSNRLLVVLGAWLPRGLVGAMARWVMVGRKR